MVGIGVNTAVGEFPRELRDTATSLALDSPDVLLGPLLGALSRWEAADERGVLVAWRDRDALLGSEVRWQDGTGIARGVDETGSLIVETAGNGRIALGAGEVHLRR